MPSLENRQFIELEKPIKELVDELKDFRQRAEKNSKVDYSATIEQLEKSTLKFFSNFLRHLRRLYGIHL